MQPEQVDRVAVGEVSDHVGRHVCAAEREGRIDGAGESDGSGAGRHYCARLERAGVDGGTTDERIGGFEVYGAQPGDDQRAGARIAE